MSTNLPGILAKLDNVQRSSTGHTARCPAHDDRKNSLSIGVGDDGRVLLHCFAGCTTERIVSVLGFHMFDLFPNKAGKHGRARRAEREIVATYDYRGADGALLFQVVRYADKSFRQRRPDGQGGWISNLDGVERVPYRLPELLAADPNEIVYIPEGEKDADRLSALGLVATCNPGGAGKWKDSYSEVLRGRTVVILVDNDDAGRRHAQMVARSLALVGCVVRIVALPDLPPKGDVSDFLDKGGTLGELVRLVNSSEPYTPQNASEAGPSPSEPGKAGVSSYAATADGLVWYKRTQHGVVPVQLTNFAATIIAECTRDDGIEAQRSFELEITLDGQTVRCQVTPAQFAAMNWPLQQLGARAMVYPGQAIRDHVRAAIQTLSNDLVTRRVYTHTGWRDIGGTWIYLHATGGISPEGFTDYVNVDLPGGLDRFALPPPPTGDDLVRAVRASLQLLDLGPAQIVIPLFSAIWRSILGPCDVALHIAGPTGALKSELAARIQQHFGTGFDRTHLPGSWSSTDNALEGVLFAVKDAIFCIDDFAPSGSRYDIDHLHRKADRVLRAQGNRSGRQRMRQDATLRPVKPPRGLILSTGEDIPRGQSIRARICIIEIGPNDISEAVLTECQKAGSDGLFAQATSAYIRWLAERYEEVHQRRDAEQQELRSVFHRSAQHRRTPDNIAKLALGLRYFLNFAEDVGAISAQEAADLWNRGEKAFRQVGLSQGSHHDATDPALRFVELLASALASGNAHVADSAGNVPQNPNAWGWRQVTVGHGVSAGTDWRPQGDRIGWLNGPDLYLDPAAAYRATQRMLDVSGGSLGVALTTLTKRLHEHGLLRTTERGGRQTYTVRRMLAGSRRKVLHMNPAHVMPTEPDQPDQSDQPASEPDENGCDGPVEWSGMMQRRSRIRPADPTSDGESLFNTGHQEARGQRGQAGQGYGDDARNDVPERWDE